MSNSNSILGTPPGPATRGDLPETVSQEDRILAAVAYLGHFAGFWLIAPLVIYVVRRDKSRFVAHHAMRAILLHAIGVPVLLVSWALGVAASIAIASAAKGMGLRGDALGPFLFLAMALGYVLPGIGYLAVCGVSVVRAAQGRTNRRSLLGRLVERILGAEKAPAAAGGAQ